MRNTVATLLAASLLTGCVLEEDDNGVDIQLELSGIEGATAEVIVTVTGDDVEGQDISVTPHMQMVDGNGNPTMTHGTPFSATDGQLDDNGQFTTTAYFLMPSANGEGMKMGDWSVNVEFEGETENFPIEVLNITGPKRLFGGADDQIMSEMHNHGDNADMSEMGDMGMTEHEARTYYLFDMGRHVMDMGMNSFSVYIAARESLFDYSPVSVNEILNEGGHHSYTITDVLVEMCSNDDCTNNDWTTATEQEETGIYTANGLSLMNDEHDMIQVRLNIAGNNQDPVAKTTTTIDDKGTDDTSDDETITLDYATFKFTGMTMDHSGMHH